MCAPICAQVKFEYICIEVADAAAKSLKDLSTLDVAPFTRLNLADRELLSWAEKAIAAEKWSSRQSMKL